MGAPVGRGDPEVAAAGAEPVVMPMSNSWPGKPDDTQPDPAAPPSSEPGRPAPSAAPPPPGPWSPPPAWGPPPAPSWAPPPGAASPPPARGNLGEWDLDFAGPNPPPPTPAPPAPPPAITLEVTVGSRQFPYVLSEGVALIGRPDPAHGIRPEIDMRPDDAVSRRHAQIAGRNGRFFVTDLGSTNGSYLNGQPLPPHVETEIRAGDELQLGEFSRIRVRTA